MGDVEDVEFIAENLEMNQREQARYELHKEDIKIHSVKVVFWRFWHLVWEVLFFWGLVVIAIETGETVTAVHAPSIHPAFELFNYVTVPMAIVIGFVGPISFFIMMWAGLKRSFWEGKLTRATAYCLAFLANIEHRKFIELEIRDVTKKIKTDPKKKDQAEYLEKLANLKRAFMERQITKEMYRKNLKALEDSKGKK